DCRAAVVLADLTPDEARRALASLPDYAVVKLPMTVVDPLRDVGEESVGAAAFIWSTVPDRGGPRDAFNVYQLLHEWQDFSHRLHDAGHQAYCLVWP
ncbi:hypothetical protein ACWDXT_35355, partial [Streptomyces sp. NPDC003236]